MGTLGDFMQAVRRQSEGKGGRHRIAAPPLSGRHGALKTLSTDHMFYLCSALFRSQSGAGRGADLIIELTAIENRLGRAALQQTSHGIGNGVRIIGFGQEAAALGQGILFENGIA